MDRDFFASFCKYFFGWLRWWSFLAEEITMDRQNGKQRREFPGWRGEIKWVLMTIKLIENGRWVGGGRMTRSRRFEFDKVETMTMERRNISHGETRADDDNAFFVQQCADL